MNNYKKEDFDNPDKIISSFLDLFRQSFPVEWDRYTVSGKDYCVYGWIERRDGKRDFVLLNIDLSEYYFNIGFTTSSAKYSAKIYEFLYGKKEGHNSCIKVSDLKK